MKINQLIFYLWHSRPLGGGASCCTVIQVSWSAGTDSSSGFVSDLHTELCHTDESGTTLHPPARCPSVHLMVHQAPPPAAGHRHNPWHHISESSTSNQLMIDQSHSNLSASCCLSSTSCLASCYSECTHWPLPVCMGGAPSSTPLWCHCSISAGWVFGRSVLWGDLSLKKRRISCASCFWQFQVCDN